MKKPWILEPYDRRSAASVRVEQRAARSKSGSRAVVLFRALVPEPGKGRNPARREVQLPLSPGDAGRLALELLDAEERTRPGAGPQPASDAPDNGDILRLVERALEHAQERNRQTLKWHEDLLARVRATLARHPHDGAIPAELVDGPDPQDAARRAMLRVAESLLATAEGRREVELPLSPGDAGRLGLDLLDGEQWALARASEEPPKDHWGPVPDAATEDRRQVLRMAQLLRARAQRTLNDPEALDQLDALIDRLTGVRTGAPQEAPHGHPQP